MLLRFSVSNHLSLRNRQALSLVASALNDEQFGLIECDEVPRGHVLPAVVIYGANASGKSNLVGALRSMLNAVQYSHSRGDPEGGLNRLFFALDPDCTATPSIFDADFVVDGVRYHYGFEASDSGYNAEWLYSFPSGRRQNLFERKNGSFTFGRGLKGRNKTISDLTRSNSLFLSAAAQNGHEQLSKIARFFRSISSDIEPAISSISALRRLSNYEMDERVIEFLRNIGTGVVGYQRRVSDIPDDIKVFQQELESIMKKFVGEERFEISREKDKDVKIELAHRSRDGTKIYFDLDRESAGTRRLLVMLARTFSALDEGTMLVIDELDASLHTQACEALLALFSSRHTNPKGAQLIATTHDTNLLRSRVLRRDQVWFTEKDKDGATNLYPLTDIRTRKGDNIERGYLQGRFGAIPFAGSVDDLFGWA